MRRKTHLVPYSEMIFPARQEDDSSTTALNPSTASVKLSTV
jgi:hypothetical protein